MQLKLTTSEVQEQAPEELGYTLDELARQGAQRMIALALELEVAEYVARHRPERDEAGYALVVRNGKARPRQVVVGAAAVRVEAPRVNDRREGEKFRSEILPPYVRRSRRLDEALPILYLRGLSTGDFAPALAELLGEAARGFSPQSMVRLKSVWEQEYETWRKRDLSGVEYIYLFADGINFSIRLEAERLTCLVVVGVRADGTREVVALEDGYRESKDSWLAVLRDLKRRGMNPPLLAVGDGGLGFWSALEEVYPECARQRCWVHKIRNVLDRLPKRLQAKAKSLLHEIMHAPDRASAEQEIAVFQGEFGAKYPRAVECIDEDQEELLTFLDFPAEHWVHLRTSNGIESIFSPVKVRHRKTKGSGSRKAGLAMAYKLITVAQSRWRRINAPHLAAVVSRGGIFKDGVLVAAPRQEVQSEPQRVAA
jgi:putative transposase